MPVRRNIVRDLVHRVIGVQVWDGLRGEPVTIPRAEWDLVVDAADQLYDEVIRRIDWKRIHIEASGRHIQLHEWRDEAPCGECIQQALLFDENGLGLSALHKWTELATIPPREARPDWAQAFAAALRWRQPTDPDRVGPKPGVPAAGSRPPCAFDDCDSDDAPAVAVVPQTSTGMTTPYRWTLSCAACLPCWQRSNPDARPIALVPDADLAGTDYAVRVTLPDGQQTLRHADDPLLHRTVAEFFADHARGLQGVESADVVQRPIWHGPWSPAPGADPTPAR